MQIHSGQEARPEPAALLLAFDGLAIVVAVNAQSAYELACSFSAGTRCAGHAVVRSPACRLELARLES
jgi:hypothetical protein